MLFASRTTAWLAASAAVAVAAAGLSGCSAARSVATVKGQFASPRGEAQRLIYELDEDRSGRLLAVIMDPDDGPAILPVSLDESVHADQSLPSAQSARLELFESSDGGAWAYVTIKTAPPQIYRLRVSAGELALALQGLAASGLFSGQERPSGGAYIEVRSQTGTVNKQWTPEPRLDELSERVLTQGERVQTRGASSAGQARVTVPLPPLPES